MTINTFLPTLIEVYQRFIKGYRKEYGFELLDKLCMAYLKENGCDVDGIRYEALETENTEPWITISEWCSNISKTYGFIIGPDSLRCNIKDHPDAFTGGAKIEHTSNPGIMNYLVKKHKFAECLANFKNFRNPDRAQIFTKIWNEMKKEKQSGHV